jgi:hypothetical protein
MGGREDVNSLAGTVLYAGSLAALTLWAHPPNGLDARVFGSFSEAPQQKFSEHNPSTHRGGRGPVGPRPPRPTAVGAR